MKNDVSIFDETTQSLGRLILTISGKGSAGLRQKLRTLIERRMVKTGTSHWEGVISPVDATTLASEVKSIANNYDGGARIRRFVLTVTVSSQRVITLADSQYDSRPHDNGKGEDDPDDSGSAAGLPLAA